MPREKKHANQEVKPHGRISQVPDFYSMTLRIHYQGRMHPDARCESIHETVFRFAEENGLFNPMQLEIKGEPTEEMLTLLEETLGTQVAQAPNAPEDLFLPGDTPEQQEQMMMMGLLIDGSIFQINIAGGVLLPNDFPRDPVSIATHMMVVDLLRQIEPYFSEFKVRDEGGYWATRDLIQLQQRRDEAERLVEGYRAIERARK
jgi:hypothetical protein